MPETPKYYITRGRNQSGPFTNSELRRKAATGSLLPTDLIFKDGMPQWVKAKRVIGLFPIEKLKPIIESRYQELEPENNVDNSQEFEEIAKKSFVSKIKLFVIYSFVVCGFLVFLITMSLSIVTTKEQRLEFAKKVEQQRVEREKRSIEAAKIRAEKELIAKKQAEEEAARNPKPVNPNRITKDEWRAIFDKSVKEGPGAHLDRLDRIFGKAVRSQTLGKEKYLYYECKDGTIQFNYEPLFISKTKDGQFVLGYQINDF